MLILIYDVKFLCYIQSNFNIVFFKFALFSLLASWQTTYIVKVYSCNAFYKLLC